VLNPIDTDAVIRDGGAAGAFPDQIHEGVAWWLGACLVVTQKAPQVAVAHNGHPAGASFAERFSRGAINAQHYACTVYSLGHRTRDQLMTTLGKLAAPGAWICGEDTSDGTTVRIELLHHHGAPFDDATGLAEIRRLIAEDRVPIPVNDRAKGRVVPWPGEEGGDHS